MKVIETKEELVSWFRKSEEERTVEMYVRSAIFSSEDESLNIKIVQSPYQIYQAYGETFTEYVLDVTFKGNYKIFKDFTDGNVEEISFETLSATEFLKYDYYLSYDVDKLSLCFVKLKSKIEEILVIEGERLEILEEYEEQQPVEPVLSNDSIELILENENIPKASELRKLFKKSGASINFEGYWDEKIPEASIGTNLNGVYIKNSTIKNKYNSGMQIQISDTATSAKIVRFMNFSDDSTLFDILITSVMKSINYKAANCGNISFTKEEWEKYQQSGVLDTFSKISTAET